MSEGEALSEWLEDEEDYPWYEKPKVVIRSRRQGKSIVEMRMRYFAAEKAKVGSCILCVCCGKQIVKNSYQTKFCSNRGKGNCKDKFHNENKRHH